LHIWSHRIAALLDHGKSDESQSESRQRLEGSSIKALEERQLLVGQSREGPRGDHAEGEDERADAYVHLALRGGKRRRADGWVGKAEGEKSEEGVWTERTREVPHSSVLPNPLGKMGKSTARMARHVMAIIWAR
jgi:hypothetical protein